MQLRGELFDQSTVATGLTERLDCDLLFRAVGCRGLPVAGLRCCHVVVQLNSGLKWRDSFGGYHRSIEDYRWYRRT